MTSPRDASPTGTSKPPVHLPKKRILVIFGTRPEAIKLCPVVEALGALSPAVDTLVCATGQHREMLDQVLAVFRIRPDFDLNVMVEGQTLPGLTARLLAALEPIFRDVRPDLAIVQGDTTTTFCGALSAFYARTPIAHVEAGLRTGDLNAPFPEELNRTATSRMATLHFAPTQSAAENLLREGIAPERIEVTGNTGVDALLQIRDRLEKGELTGLDQTLPGRKHLVAITAHRRESFGDAFRNLCLAVSDIAARADVQIVWPVHPNPNVRDVVNATLRGRDNVILTEPMPYVPFVDLLRRATVILTDSGGIQEEAPSLGTPVLVLRDKTERPEAVAAGTAKLVGSDRERIVQECNRLLDNPSEIARMAKIQNPYGDGRASERIARSISAFLTHHNVR
jgi:UDP-N-acetylglucosamine 2-epimerase (non-hydrolysing)